MGFKVVIAGREHFFTPLLGVIREDSHILEISERSEIPTGIAGDQIFTQSVAMSQCISGKYNNKQKKLPTFIVLAHSWLRCN